MSEDMQPQGPEAQAGRAMPDPDIIAAADQPHLPAVQQDKDHDDEESSAGGTVTCGPEETCIPSSELPPAENENVGSLLVHETDPIEVELVARLDTLLVKDAELSATYGTLLRNHRKTWRERRAMRAELRQLHTEEGAILHEVKLHRARKGRDGGWAEFLRQRKPKRLSRTTADRWIQWHLDSKKQEQSQSEPPAGQEPENAPQNESGAFSGGDADSQPASSDPHPPVATDPPSANGSETFEDVQQVILLLKKSQAAHFKAAAEFLVAKIGFGTSHEAIYVTFTEAAARLGFVYPTSVAEKGETTNVSKGVNPGTETSAAGSKAARKESTLDQQ